MEMKKVVPVLRRCCCSLNNNKKIEMIKISLYTTLLIIKNLACDSSFEFEVPIRTSQTLHCCYSWGPPQLRQPSIGHQNQLGWKRWCSWVVLWAQSRHSHYYLWLLRRASSLVEERETAAAQTSIQKPVLVPSADVGAGEATGSAAVVALPLAKVVGTTWAGHHISWRSFTGVKSIHRCLVWPSRAKKILCLGCFYHHRHGRRVSILACSSEVKASCKFLFQWGVTVVLFVWRPQLHVSSHKSHSNYFCCSSSNSSRFSLD